MALETEIKFLNVDHDALRLRLVELGAQRLSYGFESNVVYDDAARTLKAQGTLLRLREKNSRFVLTLKTASAQTSNLAKVYEESETEVLDAPAMREILAGLGYLPALCYEKVREEWSLLGCEVCLDTLPFGCFAEIEGDEADIQACAAALSLPQSAASKATYHDLNRQHRTAQGLSVDESFVFNDTDKALVLSRMTTD
ncbi:MAG: class IV adenylate cyclase [Humidesulfovibrio sp.]|jgi:adenylate cyclase class 2|uniref:class IV adenylate cyclase n=1 Tax=Humidesulfovibrio sp. TaxID=2910988 RepID=UPI002736995C|nr:class IV adenylate cyclase [Humidesulfovibrio sp.]MDP2848029.1 class IV adenylate cyclase [Humidesulfovibrio sp.]